MKKLKITQGKYTLVDDHDYKELAKYKWRAIKDKDNFYVGRTVDNRTVFMHRVIMENPKGLVTDHINGDGLDNRRENLRVCTLKENARNRKVRGTKGIHWHPQAGKWRAQIYISGKNKHLGLFADKQEALKAYDKAASSFYGEFARTNTGL